LQAGDDLAAIDALVGLTLGLEQDLAVIADGIQGAAEWGRQVLSDPANVVVARVSALAPGEAKGIAADPHEVAMAAV